MYCRIYEPGKTIISHGQKLTEMYFISKGSAIFYDQKGVTPFIQLPQYSFFGEYQLMFDLRSTFVVKVGGKEDFLKQTAKQDRTTFLCVSQEVFENLFDQFPKSKIVIQKRALERRRVFMDHLELLEKFLDKKAEKMARMKEKRLLEEKINKLKREIQQKRQNGVKEQDIADLVQALQDLEEEVSPTFIEDPENAKYDLQKELEDSMSLSDASALDGDTNDYNVSHFDDFDSKSMDIKNF